MRDEISNPTGLNLLVGVNQKKLVNVFKVKVQHHQFYQELVRDVVDRTGIVRPKAMFLASVFSITAALSLLFAYYTTMFTHLQIYAKQMLRTN